MKKPTLLALCLHAAACGNALQIPQLPQSSPAVSNSVTPTLYMVGTQSIALSHAFYLQPNPYSGMLLFLTTDPNGCAHFNEFTHFPNESQLLVQLQNVASADASGNPITMGLIGTGTYAYETITGNSWSPGNNALDVFDDACASAYATNPDAGTVTLTTAPDLTAKNPVTGQFAMQVPLDAANTTHATMQGSFVADYCTYDVTQEYNANDPCSGY